MQCNAMQCNAGLLSFIFDFLQLFNVPKATLTRLKNNTSNANKADFPENGEVALIQQLYFKPVQPETDLYQSLEQLKKSPTAKTHKTRFLFVTDFRNVEVYDVKADDFISCPFNKLHKEYAFFLPLAGFEKATLTEENPADTKAAEKMGRLFDAIQLKNSLDQHSLNLFLTRLLFCFFAEDTNIFAKQSFSQLLNNHSDNSGSQLQAIFSQLFTVLNLSERSPERAKYPTHLTAFPYVNGGLFADSTDIPEFDTRSRRLLLECSQLDWSEINPDIFGSMFQAVIEPKKRRSLGQHYTSVQNIMKVIKPLFLDPLYTEFENIKSLKESKTKDHKLTALLQRLSEIKIFDPACGSGNFLIIAYKEFRKLEIEIFKALSEVKSMFSYIQLDQFYGLEIDDFACETARLSMWLAEHQMNVLLEKEIGIHQPTLPLKNSGRIFCANSLRENWEVFCPRQSTEDEVYIIGNPPFIGKNNRTDEQTKDMEQVFQGFKTFKSLDYVTNWFWKGANYIKASKAKLGLVSTNSICQGEQVATLWKPIFDLGVSIHFAYQTFAWKNSAKDNVTVHTIIVGLSAEIEDKKTIYKEVNGNLIQQQAVNISPYLTERSNLAIEARSNPISSVSKMLFGNKPVDGGFLLLEPKEKEQLTLQEPNSQKWIKKLLGAEEFINNKERYCLWLVNISDEELQSMPAVMERVKKVKVNRLKSKDSGARKLAERPHQFRDLHNPKSFILIPSVSSESRDYIPLGIFDSQVISSNRNYIIPNGSLYEFGILHSEMHNDWMRLVSGRLESRYSYSATIVYNNFPFPEVTEAQKAELSELAEDILLVRQDYPDMTLAELYNPETMPEPLKQAHETLDKAVEKCYRDKPFTDSSERVAFLFQRYEELIKAEQQGGK